MSEDNETMKLKIPPEFSKLWKDEVDRNKAEDILRHEMLRIQSLAEAKSVEKDVATLKGDIHTLKQFIGFQEGAASAHDWRRILDQLFAKGEAASKELDTIKAKAAAQLEAQGKGLKDSLAAWETAVKEKIALDETGKEWEKKEQRHKVGANLWATLFGISLLSVASLIYFVAVPRFTEVLARPAGQEISYADTILRLLAHALPSAAALLFIVWGLRIIVRMFFVERGLAEDAAARKAMIATLAGLALDKGFDGSQRLIVMQALFRERAESTVSDGSPMEAIQAIATTSLQRK